MNSFGGLLLILMEDHQNDKIITAHYFICSINEGANY